MFRADGSSDRCGRVDSYRYTFDQWHAQSVTVSCTDRNGKHFGAILNYLRDGTIPLPETRRELMELQVITISSKSTNLL